MLKEAKKKGLYKNLYNVYLGPNPISEIKKGKHQMPKVCSIVAMNKINTGKDLSGKGLGYVHPLVSNNGAPISWKTSIMSVYGKHAVR